MSLPCTGFNFVRIHSARWHDMPHPGKIIRGARPWFEGRKAAWICATQRLVGFVMPAHCKLRPKEFGHARSDFTDDDVEGLIKDPDCGTLSQGSFLTDSAFCPSAQWQLQTFCRRVKSCRW